MAATILLPRGEVTVRQIALPGVTDKDLDSAIRFEIDSLNPYSEEQVAYDWARIGQTASVLVAITRQSVVDRYIPLFSQAGVKTASFTFSAPTIYTALRLLSSPPKDGLVAIEPAEDGLELYGESATRPIFSARLDQAYDGARTLAVSELRLPPETEVPSLCDRLPRPVAQPETYDASRACLAYAAALAGAGPASSSQLEFAAARAAAIGIPSSLCANRCARVHRPAVDHRGARLSQLFRSPLRRVAPSADPGGGSVGEKGRGCGTRNPE